MRIDVASVYSGLSLGPVIGGFLTHNFSWRSIFFANIITGITIIYLVTVKLKGEWAEAEGEAYDWRGILSYSLAFILFMAGPTGVGGYWRYPLLAGGVGAFAFFVTRELRISNPLLDLRLFRIPSFAFSNLAALINYCATAATGFLMCLYLQDIRSFNPQHARLILFSQPVVMALLSPYAGRLSDKIEPRIVTSIGMALPTAGLFIFSFISESMPLAIVLTSLIIMGFGFALFPSANTNAIMSSVNRRFYGTAAGVVGTMRLTGQLLSMGIATLMFSYYLGGRGIEPSSYPLFLECLRTGLYPFRLSLFRRYLRLPCERKGMQVTHKRDLFRMIHPFRCKQPRHLPFQSKGCF